MNGVPDKRTVILGAFIVTDDGVLENGVLSFSGDSIDFIGTMEEYRRSPVLSEAETILEADGAWLLPGFIDIHVHGGAGHDFMDATVEAYEGITTFHAQHGTTSILATTVTASREGILGVLKAAKSYREQSKPGAYLAGVHLEGPFINRKMAGAQNPAYMLPAQPDWMEEWIRDYPDLIRIVTLAPELDGALDAVQWLRDHGIVASCGHTDATYEQIQAAADRGLQHAVHTFNAMKGLHHREPGTAGAVLSDDRISAEVIADGHHVHPGAIRVLARCKLPDKLILITDAMSAAGLGDGSYDLGGLGVTVANGVARLTEGGSLAGSTLTMMEAFRFAVAEVGLTVPEASRAASGNPARQIGLSDRTGTLAVGKRADLLLIDPELELRQVWVQGRAVK